MSAGKEWTTEFILIVIFSEPRLAPSYTLMELSRYMSNTMSSLRVVSSNSEEILAYAAFMSCSYVFSCVVLTGSFLSNPIKYITTFVRSSVSYVALLWEQMGDKGIH